ncbi:CAMK family protein kinase [Histomonas meleagridis]|uniref:CAMK family protein kinase n=1 Tax=Histomonas meleagridis TaxID=135588 RepID=UPI00355A5871|nr:CAMK family protein kinase [Histomonas meleagridis]KAH0804139.1 CAMK family protein kinase [Histomonas meleagridis]
MKDSKSKDSALREAKLLSRMSHPNVIMYIDSFFDQQGDFYIVQEYADGKDLQKYLKTHHELSEKQVLQIFTQLILGLDYIHSQNILHRDIKTANVFLFRKGLVKLGDFGIARKVGEDNLASSMIGTPFFLCPELLKGQKYGFPADIWAAGCVLYELLTGRHAFTGQSREELFSNIMSGKKPPIPDNYSRGLTDLLIQMLDQDPSKRPTCKDIIQTDVIGQGLNALQAKLTRYFSGNHGNQKSTNKHHKSSAPSSPRSNKTSPRRSDLNSFEEEDDDDELEQGIMPNWIISGDNVGEELLMQSMKHLEKDANRLLGVVRSSISRQSIKSLPMNITPQMITGNLKERKRKLENEARKGLGDNYEMAYDFISKYGQNKRDELISQLKMKEVPEKELAMIETLTAIEACE